MMYYKITRQSSFGVSVPKERTAVDNCVWTEFLADLGHLGVWVLLPNRL